MRGSYTTNIRNNYNSVIKTMVKLKDQILKIIFLINIIKMYLIYGLEIIIGIRGILGIHL